MEKFHSKFNTFALLVQKLWKLSLGTPHLVKGFPMILKAQQGTPQFKRVQMWSKTKQKQNKHVPTLIYRCHDFLK
jgi:hypothetical protein